MMLNRPHLTLLLRSALLCIATLLAQAPPAAAAPSLGGGTSKCDPTVQSCAPGTGGGIDLGGGGGSGGGTCTPSPGGSTCGGSGPATQGNSSATNQGAGNPIHLINGNKYQREVDMPALPGVLGLEVVRHYNSSYSRAYVPPGLLGRGWLLSYEARLHDNPSNLQIVQADGTRIIFSKLRDHPSLCASEQPGNGIVHIEGQDNKETKDAKTSQDKHYVWQWMDGRELRFNHLGRLTRISLPSGEQVRLDYNDKGNRLLKVTDPQGRSLRLHYAQSSGEGSFTGVQAIDTPLGRIDYRHGSAPLPGSTQPQAKLNTSLVQVSLPSADGQAPVQRHYHYEDPRHPTLLTGISVQGQGSDGKQLNERIASYGYGDTGRAISSVRGPPDSQQQRITLDLTQPWKNTLTNSLGQKTTYRGGGHRHAGPVDLARPLHGVWPAAGAVQASELGFEMPLRLPGQYHDAETGLHYNLHRYYDPDRGQYLTPDPLGTPDGPNPYGYVRGNPLRYVDPEGLILFAFDGTNNSNPPPKGDTWSNVYKFYLAYDENVSGKAWYMNGVGRYDDESKIKPPWNDHMVATTARARVDHMLSNLDEFIEGHAFSDGKKVSIDIVGFSRGAAMGRDFSNRVATRLEERRWKEKSECVELRFLGLWDTVAQFGANGRNNDQWQLDIPSKVQYVFQAVALNEHRYLFPGESISRGTQLGFIGSHADIGGSFGTGDLSNVALNWITEKAKDSGLTMKKWDEAGNEAWGKITNPVLHDKSNRPFIDTANPDEQRKPEESAFCLRDNNGRAKNCIGRKEANPGGMNSKESERFLIHRPVLGKDVDGESIITGDINMKEYAQWLKENYGLTVELQ